MNNLKDSDTLEAIQVEKLTKKFNELVAVDAVSFTIQKGEIFGLLGPNGAGKTTIISMLSTLLKPTSGMALVNRYSILENQDEVRKSIGIVFQDQSLDEELTAYENMDFHGRLYRIPKDSRHIKIVELLKLVGLTERRDGLVKTFSGGMRRRLEMARGLLHEPKVMFLDEPTLGLDPQTRNHLWQYIEKLNKEKKITIILTTHYMDEADKLCGKVAIIDKGKIISLDTPEKLKEAIGADVVTIASSDADKLSSELETLSWIKNIEKHDGLITVNLKNAEKRIAEIVHLSMNQGITVNSMSIHKPTLEDVFLNFTGRTIREEEADHKDRMRMRRRAWRR